MVKKVSPTSKTQGTQFIKPKQIVTFAGRKITIETKSNLAPKVFEKKVNILSKGTFADKLCLLQHNVRFQNKTQETQQTQSILSRSVFEDILGLIKKSENKSKMSDNEISQIDEGLSLLSEVDKGSKDVYQAILLRHFYKLNKLDVVAVIYKEQIDNLETSPLKEKLLTAFAKIQGGSVSSLKSWIQSCQEVVAPIFSVNAKKQNAYEDECFALLNKMLTNKAGTKKEGELNGLNESEKAKVNAFLIYAYANGDLNKRIRSRPSHSKAEELISEFTYTTIGSKKGRAMGEIASSQIMQSVDAVNGALDRYQLRDVCTNLKKIPTLEIDVFDLVHELETNPETLEVIQDGMQFFTKISDSSQSIWEYRRSKEYAQNIESLLNKVRAVSVSDPKIEKKIGELNTHLRELQKIVNSSNYSLNKFLKSNKKDRLSFMHLNKITTFRECMNSIRPVARQCGRFAGSPILSDFYMACGASHTVIQDLQLLIDATSSSKPGDVSIEDEVLYKNYNQSSSIAFSSFSIFRNFRDIAKLLVPESIWQVQPYFTGRRTHAGLMVPLTSTLDHGWREEVLFPDTADQDPDETIHTSYKTRQIAMTPDNLELFDEVVVDDYMYGVKYRPNFKNILTEKNKKYEVEAQQLYTASLKQCVEEEDQWEELKGYQLDPSRGARSFVMSLVPRFGNLKQYVAALWDFMFGSAGILRSLLNSYLSNAKSQDQVEEVLKDANKRFCTELVAQLVRQALKSTEEAMQKKYGKEGAPYFHQVIPDYIDASEIYGNKLEELLKTNDYFYQLKPPEHKTILTQLFDQVPEERV